MLPIIAALAVITVTPAGYLWIDYTMLCVIGCFVYPVINLITIAALDLVSKKAIGTAAGFIGLFGYLGKMRRTMVDWPIRRGLFQIPWR